MANIHPHINFNGNAEEAFLFYQSVLGGEINKIIRFKEMNNPDFPIPSDEEEKIMHISLSFGQNLLMGNDVPSAMGRTNEMEHRSKIVVECNSREEAHQIFMALAKDGTVEFPIADSPWGTYFGMLRDRYGVEWMVQYNAP